VIATILCVVTSQHYWARAYGQLRESHPEVWRNLGSPSSRDPGTFPDFMRQREYTALEDPLFLRLLRVAETARKLSLVTGIAALIVVFAFFFLTPIV
jgi:hypothetical protein